jgi:hypothetical protein
MLKRIQLFKNYKPLYQSRMQIKNQTKIKIDYGTFITRPCEGKKNRLLRNQKATAENRQMKETYR